MIVFTECEVILVYHATPREAREVGGVLHSQLRKALPAADLTSLGLQRALGLWSSRYSWSRWRKCSQV